MKGTQPTIVREILRLRRSLKTLDRSFSRLAPILSAAVTQNGTRKGSNQRRPPRLSPKGRASLVLQGRYIGFMRHLKSRQKAQVRKIREAKGMRAAIQRAREMARA